jgi:hypothetical protein
MTALDLDAVRAALAGYEGTPGHLAISSTRDMGGCRFATSAEGIRQAVDYVAKRDHAGEAGIYHRGTTVREEAVIPPGGRGKAEHSCQWLRFQADLDYGKTGYAPDAETVLRVVKGADLPEPSAFVNSGHGLYPQWELAPAEPDSPDVRALAAGIATELHRAFTAEGFTLDKSIGADAARVWRIPGTVNRKPEMEPVACRVIERTATAYRLHDLRAAVPLQNQTGPDQPAAGSWEDRAPFTTAQARAFIMEPMARLRAATQEGDRNNALNAAAMALGHFINPGFWSYEDAEKALIEVCEAIGYAREDSGGMRRTIASGLAAGMAQPAQRAEGEEGTANPGAPQMADNVTEQRKRLRLIRGSEITPQIARWLWKDDQGFGRIPLGEVSVAAGRGNVGKSPFALWLAARLSRGELPGQLYGTPVDVLIYASEDSHDHTTVPRLIAAGADMVRVHLIYGTATDADPDIPLDWTGDLPLIRAAIIELGARFLVIDPLFDVYRSGANTDKVDDVRTGLRPLVAMAHVTGTSVLGLAHFNKQRTGDIASLLSGSHALRDVVRAVIAFAVDADGVRMLGQDKNNLGRSGSDIPVLTYDMTSVSVEIEGQLISQPVFTITGATDVTMGDVLSGGGGTQAGELPRDLEWLFDLIAASHPWPLAVRKCVEVAEERGLRWDTVSRKARKTGLFEYRQERGAVACWVWGLSQEGRRRAGKTPEPGPMSQSGSDPFS